MLITVPKNYSGDPISLPFYDVPRSLKGQSPVLSLSVTPGDDEEPIGGPPPDPSLRAWRHPSEIAAAAAAAARHEEEERVPRRRWSPLSFAIGSATGVALCLSLFGAVTLTGHNDVADSDVNIGGGLGQVEDSNQIAAATLPVGSVGTSSASTTLPGAEPPPATSPVQQHLGGTPESNGIFALEPLVGDGQIANVVAVDGLLLTSASAVGERSAMRMPLDEHQVAVVRVVAVDRFTDVAVLDIIGIASNSPHDGNAEPVLQTLSTTPQLVVPDAGADIALVNHGGDDDPLVADGSIVATNQRTTSSDGHDVIGALTTTARVPDGAYGGALVDHEGNAFALVVNGRGLLATAIPLDEALEIAHSLMDQGWPSDGWLGVEATRGESAVLLINVEAQSPAALAGLEPGDLVASIDDAPVLSMADLIEPLRRAEVGDVLMIEVERDGATSMVEIVMAAKDTPPIDSSDEN